MRFAAPSFVEDVGDVFFTMSTGELLALDLDLIDEAKSYGHTLLQPPWSPTSPRSPRDELETILPTLIPMLLALPRRLDRIGDAVERNEISIGVHLFPDERDRAPTGSHPGRHS